MKNSNFLKLLFVISFMTMMYVIALAQTNPSGTVVTYNKNGTPNHGIKIKTNIPYSAPAMPTVILEGFQYGTGKSIGITLNWYVYQGNFIRYKASSSGAWTPKIKLANENNKVVIYIDERDYYTRFSVRAYGKGLPGDTNSTYAGWTVVDTEPLTGTDVVTVPYENRMGTIYSKTQNVTGSINIIGGSVKLKKPNTTGGWARGLFNTDAAGTTLGGVGLLGSADTPVRYFISHGASPWSDSKGTFFLPNGNVGIGKTNPVAKLDVHGRASCSIAFTVGAHNDNHRGLVVDNAGSHAWKLMELKNVNGTQMTVQGSGKVGIGTDIDYSPDGYRLFVKDGILTEKVKVSIASSSDWADYVFADNYNLKPLDEVAQFIETNKHLPNVPSAEEIVESGIDVAKMDAKLLEKIEELTLYMIDMNKEVVQSKEQIAELSEKIEELKKENEQLKERTIND